MNKSRWLILGLVASLVVNIAMFGFIAGRASTGGARPALMDPMRSMGRVMTQLTEERRELLQPAMRQHLRDMRAGMREVRSNQRRLNETLAAVELDREQLRDALQAFQHSLCSSMTQGHDSFIELAMSMTPEERRLLMQPERPGGRPPHPPGPDHNRFPEERAPVNR